MKKIRVLSLGVLLVVMIGGCAGIQEKPTIFGGTELAQTYLQKGQHYEDQGDLVEALKQYKLALTVDPGNREIVKKSSRLEENMHVLAKKHYQAGLKFRKKGKYYLARNEFLKALNLQPDYPEALKMLEPKKHMAAKRSVEHTIQPGESLTMVAKNYYGDYKKFSIIADYNNLADATRIRVGQKIKIPEIEGVPFLIKKQKIEVQDVKTPDLAIPDQEMKEDEDRDELEVEEPEVVDEATNYRNLGIEHFNNKEYPEAVAEFNKVLNAAPDDKAAREYLYRTHFEYALVLFKNKDYLAAKKNFEASFRYNKDCQKCHDYIKRSEASYMETHYNRGLSYFGKQQLSEAVREWELVRAVDPNYKDVEKDIEKAKTLLERLENIKKSMQ
jgi:tetratricopeptide (TPR) repeat protein